MKVKPQPDPGAPDLLIGELAERTGATPRSLRYYESLGLLTPERGTNGYRRYGRDAVDTVRVIRRLLDAGLGTATIKDLLPCVRGDAPVVEHCPRTMGLLREALGEIDESLAELERRRSRVRRLLASS